MSDELTETVEYLARLVSFDTQNPPRNLNDGGIFAWIKRALGPDFSVEIQDLGRGSINLFAVRGAPNLLLNVHLDTVPKNPAWTRDPFVLGVEDDRAYGLGACDTKGAAAAILTAVRRTKGDIALLFSSDEEAGDNQCIRAFLTSRRDFRGAVVAEPTNCRAVLSHRGIGTAKGIFRGQPGHASSTRALNDSAVHEAIRWGSQALLHAKDLESQSALGLDGIRFNIGRIEGGQKANMIAAEAVVNFGVRPPPGRSPEQVLGELFALGDPARSHFELGFTGAALPANGDDRKARQLAQELEISVGSAVDFWTEAVLFSAAGIPALVFGPGDIAEAHAKNESVPLRDLQAAVTTYKRILSSPLRV